MKIAQFYHGKNLFMSGGTGFIGKLIIEKLLRDCPDIGTIYVLIREKKGKSIHQRIQTIINSDLYAKLRHQIPIEILEQKIVPVKGNCMELGLGLSECDRQMLIDNVSIMFHTAASVRFDDPLQKAIIMNTRATREMAQLALAIPHLSVFVYVSTTYCNCVVSDYISEHLYPAPADWKRTIEIAEQFDPILLDQLTSKYLGPYPNTYTFTKALSEHVVTDLCVGKFPVAICRPSIVVSSFNDPIPGWIDNFNGPMSLMIACGKGLLRSSYQIPNVYADFVPVDIYVRMMCVAACDAAQRGPKTFDVYQCCSGNFKWLTIGDVIETSRLLAADVPFNNSIWVPKGSVTRCPFYAYINVIFFHLLPALILDLGIRLAGKKPILTRLQSRIFNAAIQLRYFTTQGWDFDNSKVMELESNLEPDEKSKWKYDFRNEDVEKYLMNAMLGTRRYLLHESDDTLPEAKVHYNRMYWLDKFTMIILYTTLFWFLYQFDVFGSIIEKLIHLITKLFAID